MTRTSRSILCLATLVHVASTGCGKTQPTQPIVKFVNPTSGQTLTVADGALGSAAGTLVVTVVAQTTNVSAGSSATLTLSSESATYQQAVDGAGALLFSNVVLAGSSAGTANTLSIAVATADGKVVAQGSITVTVMLGSTGPCTVSILPPDLTLFNETGATIGGRTTVRDTDLTTPGIQANLAVTVSSPCTDGMLVTLKVAAGSLPAVALSGGTATFSGVTLPDTPLSALQNPAQATAVTASVGPSGSLGSDTVRYLADSTTPTATLTSPVAGAALTQADDVNPGLGGLQINVRGTTQGFGGDLAAFSIIDVDGGVYAATNTLALQADGSFVGEITLINGTDSLAFQAHTATGNLAESAPIVVSVHAVPTIAIIAPTASSTLLAIADQDSTQPGLQRVILLTTTATTGSQIIACSTVAPVAGAAAGTNGCAAGTYFLGTGSAAGASTQLGPLTLGEGVQTVTVLVNDNGLPASASVTFAVHALTPIIDSLSVANAYIDPGGRLWLNASTLDGGLARSAVTVTVDPADFFGLDGGTPQDVVITQTTALSPKVIGQAPLTLLGSTLQAVVPINLADGPYALVASVSDVWGNPSDPAQVLPVADAFDLLVKTRLPSCAIAPPTQTSYWNIQDNGGDAGAGAVDVPVTVSSQDAVALTTLGATILATAQVEVNAIDGGSVPAGNGAILAQVSSPQGLDGFTATVTDPAGNPAATCSGAFSLNVATVAPTIAIAPQPDPNGGTTDGNGLPVYLGRSVPVIVTTTGLSTSASIVISIGGQFPQSVAVASNGSTPVTLQNAPNGVQSILASAVDAAGNPASASTPVHVEAPGCSLVLTTPQTFPATGGTIAAVFNAQSGTVLSNTLTTNVIFNTPDCPASLVTFTSTATGVTPLTATPDTNGNVSFALSLADGATGTFQGSIATGVTLPVVSYTTKLTPPSLSSFTPSTASLEVVAAASLTDNPYAGQTVDGGVIAANLINTIAAGYATFSVGTVGQLGPTDQNGNGGTATVHLAFAGIGTTDPGPVALASTATSVSFPSLALPPHATGTVTLTVTDNAQNSASQVWAVTTDVIPPTAPSPIASMTDQRKATVGLTWSAPADDDGSAVSGYELRYSLTGIATPTESDYALMTVDPTAASLLGAAVGSQQTHLVTGLPTLNLYSFEMRAIDAVGNRSVFNAAAQINSIAQGQANSWQQLQINGPSTAGENFGLVLRSGDFNGDGKADLAISAPARQATNTPGSVWILYGQANLQNVPTTWPNASLAQLTNNGTTNDWFGFGSETGDFNGDGFDDLAIGSPQASSAQGRVDIFFGSATGLAAIPSVTILGDATQAGQFGYSVTNIGDVNQDGIPDLLVGAPTEGSGGSVYLYLGAKAWAVAPTPVTTITGSLGDALGARSGSAPLGNGSGDFVVGAPGGDVADGGSGTVYGFSAATAIANANLSVGTNASFALTLPGYTCGGIYPPRFDCFGGYAIGGVKFSEGSTPDLLVANFADSTLRLYKTGATVATTPTLTSSYTNTGGSLMGWALATTDLNGDTFPDLLVGTNDTGTSSVYVYLNAGTSPGLPSKPSATLVGPTGSYFGYSIAIGDFDGTGVPSFAISDPVASTVLVYY